MDLLNTLVDKGLRRESPTREEALAVLATPIAIRVAATLDLVEHAAAAGATADELAAATATSAPALRRLLDHLVAAGVFELAAGR